MRVILRRPLIPTQMTPLGYGNLESGIWKPATYKRTRILQELEDDDASGNSVTKVVHTTGHRGKGKEPIIWERVDVFHCAVVLPGVAVLIQVPIVHPDFPVRKGIHRDRTVQVLVAKDNVRLKTFPDLCHLWLGEKRFPV